VRAHLRVQLRHQRHLLRQRFPPRGRLLREHAESGERRGWDGMGGR
jgi:hypothetical protein